MRRLIIGLAFTLAPCLVAHAATIQVEQHEGKTRLMLEGEIEAGDAGQFFSVVSKHRPTELELNSPGGDGYTGIALARWVNEHPEVTVVLNNYCNSACSMPALIALGRGDLVVSGRGSLGVHQAALVTNDMADVPWTRGVANQLRGYGAPEEPLDAMVSTPPTQLTIFWPADLVRLGAKSASEPEPATRRPVSVGAATAVGLTLIGLLALVVFSFISRKETQLDNAMAIRDFGRGSLEINETTLKVAYAIEGVIIAAALYAGWQFANRYASDNWDLWIMAVVGAVAICAAETARIFLAKAVRTQTTISMQVLATIGLICMCLVTTKTMATVMEQTYNPRLRQVVQANDEVKLADGDLATIVSKREAEKLPLAQLEADVKAAEEEIRQINQRISEQGAAPADRAYKVPFKSTCRNKRGKKYSCTKTITKYQKLPWAGQQFADKLEGAVAGRAAAVAKRDEQQAKVSKLDTEVAGQEKIVIEKQSEQREAVMNSQMHSFTAMVFGKDPTEVTEGELHWFLRLFIFLPAVMIAAASTILAMIAYTRVEPRQAELKIVDQENTLTKHIERAVERSIDERMAEKSQRKRKPKPPSAKPGQNGRPELRAVND